MEIVEATSREQLDRAAELFRAYVEELGEDLCFQGFEAELANLPGKYARPAGRLWVAMEGGQAVGCVAVRPIDERTCELKRLYVQPAFRRSGLGRRLTEAAVAAAREIGYRRMVLDTLERLVPALRMYESMGFERIEAYTGNPIADVVYMGKTLV